MKHLINIILLGMVLLGIAMMADTPWGLGVALAPFAIWGARFLMLIHKSTWAAILFWGGIALLQWQVAAVMAVFFGAICMLRNLKQSLLKSKQGGRRVRSDSSAKQFQDSYDYDQRNHIGVGDD